MVYPVPDTHVRRADVGHYPPVQAAFPKENEVIAPVRKFRFQ
jgi:hypothetical protein